MDIFGFNIYLLAAVAAVAIVLGALMLVARRTPGKEDDIIVQGLWMRFLRALKRLLPCLLVVVLISGCVYFTHSKPDGTKIVFYQANEIGLVQAIVGAVVPKIPAIPGIPTIPVPEVPVVEPEPPPVVEPPVVVEPPDPGPSAPSVDGIDPATLKWSDVDAGAWPIVTDLEVSIGASVIEYAHSANWANCPEAAAHVGGGGAIAGNFWIIIDGQACPWEWFRPGQTGCAKNIFHKDGQMCSGMSKSAPVMGAEVGFMVSTCARVGMSGVDTRHERSRIVKATWK